MGGENAASVKALPLFLSSRSLSLFSIAVSFACKHIWDIYTLIEGVVAATAFSFSMVTLSPVICWAFQPSDGAQSMGDLSIEPVVLNFTVTIALLHNLPIFLCPVDSALSRKS